VIPFNLILLPSVFSLLFAVCLTSPLNAQYTNLVFEGAGIRGIAYAGVIRALEEEKMLKDVERVAGTSAGAIAALTVSLGYSSRQIEKIIYDTKIQKFNDGRFLFIGGISRVNRHYGWYRGKSFTKWLEKIISDKTGDADLTFAGMHARGFPDLFVTGTSLNNQKLVVFSFETYPSMKVKDAVRISMSIPLYFEAVCIDSTGKVVDPKKARDPYDIVVDGGFTGNFPIFVFDSLASGSGSDRIPHRSTLGFRIDTPPQIAYDSLNPGALAPVPVNKFSNYVGALYNYVLENLNRSTLTKADWDRTVSISSGSIGPKIRKLSIREKNMLIENGQIATQDFMRRNAIVRD